MGRLRRRIRNGTIIGLTCASVALAGCSATSAPPSAPGPQVGQQADAALPPAITSAVLQTSTGKSLTLAALRGKIIVISDMMTLCQESCPLDTANVLAAARAVDRAGLGSKVDFLSVTIDPTRDSTAQIAAYRKLYDPAPPNWFVLTGTSATLSNFWKRFGVYIQRVRDRPPLPRNWRTGQPLTYDLTHSDEVFFVDATSHERFLLEGTPHVAPGAPLPRKLVRFMDGTGKRNLNHPDPLAWTLPQELQVLSWLTKTHIPAAGNQ